ncbi:hypothetical protein SAMN02949497_1158 [Methylomagnum ishizawai]|uniref:SPFH domain / Band 7 family protein n=1 Tax=Methylomagnum ishizawai TaxID=1760988 RepID=A0A1Y6D0D3_9GAMM|nr:hypothetical protein [Methylomagnum ishizawai]SMF93864.1 hypothetical protein SAMN02949497_1158 [Methylomagnum ishizawai]
MDEYNAPEPRWEAGFEGDRRIVVSKLGPFLKVYARPKQYTRRFFHQVHELNIEDWPIPVEPLRLGPFCTVESRLSVRFQPTLKFAREHLEHIADLGGLIKSSYATLLLDAAEQELRTLEPTGRMEEDAVQVERRIEDIVHELLALREIQCRARCAIDIVFASPDSLDEHTLSGDAKHKEVYLELLRRRRESAERLAREHYDRQLHEHQLKLEHEAKMLELHKQEAELRRQKQAHETEQVRTDLSADELRYTEQIDSEVRLREERIRHEARLRQMELEADLAEKNLRTEALTDVEHHLRREIELLALERQRLMLEEEIHDVKVARAKGWVSNAKRRLSLGEGEDPETARR